MIKGMMKNFYYKLIKQVNPRDGFQTLDDWIGLMAIYYMRERLEDRYHLYPHDSKAMELEDTTCDEIEFCQLAYEDGYSVILNDGKILGFEKAPAV